MLLAAGDQATVSTHGGVAPQHLTDTAPATAWTHRQVVFRSTPLVDVVAEFNRYNTRQFVITDPDIGSIRISGVFSSSNPKSLVQGLEALGKFKIRETPDRVEIAAR
jgi:transmembrane sensor